MKTLFLMSAICLLGSVADSQEVQYVPTPDDNERTWTDYLAPTVNGRSKDTTLLDGSFADIITDTTVWEVEWCSKWKESIGQAIHYKRMTDLKPGIWILHRGKEDYMHFQRVKGAVDELRACGFEIEFRVTLIRGE